MSFIENVTARFWSLIWWYDNVFGIIGWVIIAMIFLYIIDKVMGSDKV